MESKNSKFDTLENGARNVMKIVRNKLTMINSIKSKEETETVSAKRCLVSHLLDQEINS